MNTNQLKSLQEAEPFVPFVIVLDDKSEVSVRSREDMYIPPVNTPYVWVSGEEGGPRCILLAAVVGVRMLPRPRGKKAG